ncbi:protein GPR107-like [Cotesia typhae]|uniref:protein GPR107-like n=1 Tax=Cotesia typhae TaxID=2053667 RepID=UPI003D6965FA
MDKSNKNFSSASDISLPALYFMMASVFFFSGCFWILVLKKSRYRVVNAHYLIAILLFLKSFSLLFHGINNLFVKTKNKYVATWAIHYSSHLLNESVICLFVSIVLIGTDWDFIKRILAEKDEKLFRIFIYLQVLMSLAEIIIEESDDGEVEYKTWRDVFTLVDSLCYGVILLPVVWSIKHLKESANIRGITVVNHQKLNLFRHFYIMIVCNIYFPRIVIYFLKVTIPFRYKWLEELFKEMATFIIFVMIGYKFQPANRLFKTDDDIGSDDDQIDVVVTGTSEITRRLLKRA